MIAEVWLTNQNCSEHQLVKSYTPLLKSYTQKVMHKLLAAVLKKMNITILEPEVMHKFLAVVLKKLNNIILGPIDDHRVQNIVSFAGSSDKNWNTFCLQESHIPHRRMSPATAVKNSAKLRLHFTFYQYPGKSRHTFANLSRQNSTWILPW